MSEAVCIFLLATLSLQDAVNRAIAHSPELRMLEAQVAEARANATLANAFRPEASISTTPGYATGLPTAVLGQVPAIGTIEAHQLLYDASARAQQIGAMSQVETAIANLESRRREVAQNTADLYARVSADKTLAASAQRRVDAYQTLATRTEALRGEGRVRDLDVDRATLQVASAKRAALQAQTRLELDQLRLDRVVGESVAAGFSPPTSGLKAAATLGTAIENDPQLRSLDARINARQKALGSQNRFFLPTVAAQVQYSRLFDRYGRYYLNFKPDDFIVGATISLPIFSSGRRAATVARVNAQLQQILAARDARRTELELSLREAEADLNQALAERDLAARAHAVAEESLRIAEELVGEGRGEINGVPLAQITLADADDEVANAAAHLAAAQMKLMILRGEPI